MTQYTLNINGREYHCAPGQSILEAAMSHGVHIPNLCYDSKVAPYGACGLCVVEVEGNPKLVRACSTPIVDGMIINTESYKVRQSRKIALELLLSDHGGDCVAPCQDACPAGTDCQGYVGLLAGGYPEEALMLLKDSYPLPASLSRVCPHPCETACRRGLKEGPVAIAALKQYAADHDLASGNPFLPEVAPATGKKVAIVGAGPAGLTAAWFLARKGHAVTIYDMMPKAGGMLRYGIPQYRLPKEVLDEEIALIEKLGVTILPNQKLGRDIDLATLRQNYHAVYLAIGAWQSSGLGCPGEELTGVYGGIDFLRQVIEGNPPAIGKRVAIVGGGNTAMDACRTARRLGAEEVYLLYRRTKAEMPAEELEIQEAEEEGVIYKFLVAPTEVLGENGHVSGIRLQKMELGEPDASGRRRPVAIEGAVEDLALDSIIAAIGQKVVPDGLEGVELTGKNTILTDEHSFLTSLPGVFAGGDAINKGPGIAIEAMGHAKHAAEVIDSYLHGTVIPYAKPFIVQKENVTSEDLPETETIPRHQLHYVDPAIRSKNFEPVCSGFTTEEATAEASRCLECGCFDVHECKLLAYAREYQVEPERVAGEKHKRPVSNEHPFIFRDPNKCVLCGLCVRVCDEVMSVRALGLAERGFESVVQPGFGQPLLETFCVSCGQCVNICPTGALQERQLGIKPVPLPTKVTDNVCNYCGVGCRTKVHTYGNAPVKVTPCQGGSIDDNILCRHGRFGWNTVISEPSFTSPLLRRDGNLAPVDWQTALQEATAKVQALRQNYGPDSLAVLIADRLTTEEIFLARLLGHDAIATENIYSANAYSGGFDQVFGMDGSTNTFAELEQTDLILEMGIDVPSYYAMLAIPIERAVKRGAKLLLACQEGWNGHQFLAHKRVNSGDDTGFLKQMLKALIDLGCQPQQASGFAELKESLANVVVGPDALEFATAYKEAKHAMMVFDRERTSAETARLLAEIAVVGGHIGKPRSGIIQMCQHNNTQGLIDMGIKQNLSMLTEKIESGQVKGVLLIGQFLAEEVAAKLDFVLAADCMKGPALAYADIFLPMPGYGGVNGTYTNAEGRVQAVQAMLSAPAGKDGWQVLSELLAALAPQLHYQSLAEVQEAIAQWRPAYQGCFTGEKEFATFDGNPLRYSLGFATADGLAHLFPAAQEAPMYHNMVFADIPIVTWFGVLAETGVMRY